MVMLLSKYYLAVAKLSKLQLFMNIHFMISEVILQCFAKQTLQCHDLKALVRAAQSINSRQMKEDL